VIRDSFSPSSKTLFLPFRHDVENRDPRRTDFEFPAVKRWPATPSPFFPPSSPLSFSFAYNYLPVPEEASRLRRSAGGIPFSLITLPPPFRSKQAPPSPPASVFRMTHDSRKVDARAPSPTRISRPFYLIESGGILHPASEGFTFSPATFL